MSRCVGTKPRTYTNTAKHCGVGVGGGTVHNTHNETLNTNNVAHKTYLAASFQSRGANETASASSAKHSKCRTSLSFEKFGLLSSSSHFRVILEETVHSKNYFFILTTQCPINCDHHRSYSVYIRTCPIHRLGVEALKYNFVLT